MKPAHWKIRATIRHRGLDWITAVLTLAAIALTLVALVRAAAADGTIGGRELAIERADRAERVARAFAGRLDGVAVDLDLYLRNLRAAFAHNARRLHGELGGAIEAYRRGGRSRDFDRAVRALDVRLDRLAKRVDRLAARAPRPDRDTSPRLLNGY